MFSPTDALVVLMGRLQRRLKIARRIAAGARGGSLVQVQVQVTLKSILLAEGFRGQCAESASNVLRVRAMY